MNLWKEFCRWRFARFEEKFQKMDQSEKLELCPKLLSWGVRAGIYIIGEGQGGGVSETYLFYDTRIKKFLLVDGFMDHNPMHGGYVVTSFRTLEWYEVPRGFLNRYELDQINQSKHKRPDLVTRLKNQVLKLLTD